jgi:NAD(P)H-dependent FMN reductase
VVTRILGIIGSPRELGNCELAVKEISRQTPQQHELRLLRLADFNIKLCTGCYRCLFNEQTCVLEDDLPPVIDALAAADAIVVAVPTYVLGANASLKLLLDRCLAFYARRRELWRKPALAIGVSGIEGKEGSTLLDLDRFLNFLLADKRGIEKLTGALPGEIFLNENNRKVLGRAAANLLADAPEKPEPVCNLCGGDTFRFMSNGRVKCMHCSNTGSVELDSDGPHFYIEKDDHSIFLSRADAERHFEWLKNMKQKYIENRKPLREIKSAYLGRWQWIKPAASKED